MAITELFAVSPSPTMVRCSRVVRASHRQAPDLFPQDGKAVWRVTEHGWIYIVTDAERAGKALLTILVQTWRTRSLSLLNEGR